MIENLKLTLENGNLRFNDAGVLISLEKGEHCDHYDVLMISSQGMIFGLHLETIEEVLALPIKWDQFTFIKHPEGQVIGVVPLGESEIQDSSFNGN